MNLQQLQALSKQNEVRIGNFENETRAPDYCFDSLRQAFSFYFQTFITNNSGYHLYAQGPIGFEGNFIRRQFLNEETTIQGLISFHRFFELYLKNIVMKIDARLVLHAKDRNITSILEKLDNISPDSKTINFSETIERFYGLLNLVRNKSEIPKQIEQEKVQSYSFLASTDTEASLKLLSWWRNRILHNGDSLPTTWFYDYLVSQRLLPIINQIIEFEGEELKGSLFYLKTITGTNVLDEMLKLKFEFSDLTPSRKTVYKLLKLGHLKEMGRAALTMNFFMRGDIDTFEYHYVGIKDRAKRRALCEQEHPNFEETKTCICCNEETAVLYSANVVNPQGRKLNIPWIKCYLCEYYMHFHMHDPHEFNLSTTRIFERKRM